MSIFLTIMIIAGILLAIIIIKAFVSFFEGLHRGNSTPYIQRDDPKSASNKLPIQNIKQSAKYKFSDPAKNVSKRNDESFKRANESFKRANETFRAIDMANRKRATEIFEATRKRSEMTRKQTEEINRANRNRNMRGY